MSDLITPKQINAIYSIGRTKNINPAAESRRIYGWDASELNQHTASLFITYLNAQPRRWNTREAIAARQVA
jgi:hypothetical protein